MFKRFTIEENVSSISQVKNSVQRSIRNNISSQYPNLESRIENILPKKNMLIAKVYDGMQMIVVNGEILFFNIKDGPWFPTLRLLHKYPSMMPKMQVDRGAIKFILGGANIMCPGFTSRGGNLPTSLSVDQPVAIYAEGKVHALAVGITKMSTEDIIELNKGIAVESLHYLLDELWQVKQI
jgi:PUA domain protein